MPPILSISRLRLRNALVFAISFVISVSAEAQESDLSDLLEVCKFGKPVNLLEHPELLKHSKTGEWTREGGDLSANPMVISNLYVPYEFPDRFVIKTTLKRESGGGAFGVGFVMGTGETSLVLDGWGQRFAGLHMLDGREASSPTNPTRIEKKLFEDGKGRELQIVVLARQIIVSIDGEELLRWKGKPDQLARTRAAPSGRQRMPFFYSVKTKWTITKLEVTPIESAPDDALLASREPVRLSPERNRILRGSTTTNGGVKLLTGAPPKTLFLDMHHASYPVVTYLRGGLIREISRQALAISAREEFLIPTRDRALGEEFPLSTRPGAPRNGGSSVPLSVFTTVQTDGKVQLTVFRAGTLKSFEALYDTAFEVSPETPYCDLITVLEAHSRDQFREVIYHEYLPDQRQSLWNPSAIVPVEIESQLQKWNVFSQFIGVREMHRIMRESGESPSRLAALSQGYARLGLVTSYYFGTYSKVYFARALLYAERLVAKTEGSAESLWNRAYVRALAGLPAAAHRDLKQAVEIENERLAPEWIRDLELYCEGDAFGLRQRLEEPASSSLTAFLYWKLQTCRASTVSRYDGYYQLTEKEPESLHALLSLARNEGSLGTKGAVQITAEHLPLSVRDSLLTMPELPEGVRETLQGQTPPSLEGLPAVITALKQAGQYGKDEGEPSLDTLGQLIQEALFLTSYQLLTYQQSRASGNVEEEADRLAQLLEGHPGQALIKSFGQEGEKRKEFHKAFLIAIDMKCLDQSCELYLMQAKDTHRPLNEQALNAIYAHGDLIDHEMARQFNRRSSDERFLHLLGQLERVAPNSPTAIEFRLAKARETCADKIEGWERRFPFDASLQTMFANYYMAEGRFDESERCLRRRIDLEQSYEAYQQLARMEKLRGDLDAWLAAAEESLNYPVPGLEHAGTHSSIARHFLNAGKPEKAEPHSESAANSGAHWAISVAADVQEALGHLETADNYHRSNFLRYDDGLDWYWFRMRTGFGDLQAAGEAILAQQSSDEEKTKGLTYQDFKFAYLLVLMGEEDRAYARLKTICNSASFPVYCWHVFVQAAIRGDDAVRDEMLRRIITRSYEGHDKAILLETDRIARHLQEQISAGKPGEIDLEFVDSEIIALSAGGPTTMWYILGSYLGHHGHEQEAIGYLRRAAESPLTDRLESDLSRYILRANEVELAPRRGREHIPLEFPVNTSGAVVLKHSAQGAGFAFRPESKTLVTIDWDKYGYVWNDITGDLIERFQFEGIPEKLSPDGRYLIQSDKDKDLFVVRDLHDLTADPRSLQIPSGKPINSWTIPGRDNLFLGLVRLVNRQKNPQDALQLWDLKTGQRLWEYQLLGHQVYHAWPEDDGSHIRLLVRKQKDTSTFYKRLAVSDGAEAKTHELEEFAVQRVGKSPDGSTIVMQSRENEVRIWDASTWEYGDRYWRPECSALTLSPDRSLIVLGYASGEMEICDARQQSVLLKLRDQRRRIRHLGFSNDGQKLVSSSDDGTTRLWNVDDLVDWAKTNSTDSKSFWMVRTNSIGMKLSPIPAGEFLMGRRAGYIDYKRYEAAETPAHRVRITRPFYLAQTEVTVSQFRQFVEETGYITEVEKTPKGGWHLVPKVLRSQQSPKWTWKTPAFEQTENHPVTLISWNDANAFCEWLSAKEQRVYRLPTEAEWEYACRGGTATTWFRGNDFYSLIGYVNIADVSYWEFNHKTPGVDLPSDGFIFTAPVASFRPNGYGLYDILGNVSEWCQDWYGKDYYQRSPAEDPTGPETGTARVYRGGSYVSNSNNFRPARRHVLQPQYGQSRTGFRVLMEIENSARSQNTGQP